MSLLAIDVGGSASRWRTTDAEGTAPGFRIGEEGIVVAELLEPVARSLGEEPDLVVLAMSGVLGLAGRIADVHAAIRSWWPAARTVVCSDAVSALVGAHGLGGGVVVSAGTGAIGLGSDLQTIWRRTDGWGHVLGDEGSAAWIGIEGLRAALRGHDGRPGGSAALMAAARARFGPLRQLPSQIYTRQDRSRVLAEFAPDVSAAAAHDDVARTILATAGAHLAETAIAAQAPGVPRRAALVGGVRAAGAPLLAAFAGRLQEAGLEDRTPAGTSLDGAEAIARALAEDFHAIAAGDPYLTKEIP
ncbi:N-acetylglucosamine kinase [Microbacterium soli]|uniref:BadF/BadG/BcrA/BcrD ATPase family protein n=1 Tax=Microbacterium soli TaxID=446075 RepID=A0ABP7MWW4_9MICO